MSALVIATATDQADYTIRTRLDGRDYGLRFMFNQRENRWYMHLLDNEDTLIVGGLKLIPKVGLLRHYQSNPAVPPGEFFVIDQTRDGRPPGIDELGEGKRCSLVYLPEADIPTVAPSPPTVVAIYLSFTITTSGGYAGDDAFKQTVADQCTRLLRQGVKASRCREIALAISGVASVDAFTVGRYASPLGTADLRIGAGQYAAFDVSRITVSA